MSRPYAPGDRVRDRDTRIAGLVLARVTDSSARVAFEGQAPREVPDDQLERVR